MMAKDMAERHADYVSGYPCGCSLDAGRCEVHAAMMRVLRRVYGSDDTRLWQAVASEVDGFGIKGSNAGDWSAWRDSSIEAVERAWRKATLPRFAAALAEVSPR